MRLSKLRTVALTAILTLAASVLAPISVANADSLESASAKRLTAANRSFNDLTILGTSTFYAYLNKGETLYADGFFHRYTGGGAGYWRIYNGNGTTVHNCGVTQYAGNNSSCSASLVAAEDSVFKMEYVSAGGAAADVYIDQANFEVQANGVPKKGRVWSENLELHDNITLADLNLYYLSDVGVAYKTTYKGFRGVNSAFSASSHGVVPSNTSSREGSKCLPVWMSVPTTGEKEVGGLNGASYAAKTSACTPASGFKQYRVFLNTPDASMPSSVSKFAGEDRTTANKWVYNPYVLPTIVSVQKTRLNTSDQDARVKVVTAGTVNGLWIKADMNGNGSTADTADCGIVVTDPSLLSGLASGMKLSSLEAAASGSSPGTFFVNSAREPLTSGSCLPSKLSANQEITLQVTINRDGDIHFLMDDVEGLPSGLIVNRILPAINSTAERRQVSWDDSALTTTNRCSTMTNTGVTTSVKQTDADSGAYTAQDVGVHRWSWNEASSSCNNVLSNTDLSPTNQAPWGNNRRIDNWASFVPSSASSQTVDLSLNPLAKLTLTAEVAAKFLYETGDSQLKVNTGVPAGTTGLPKITTTIYGPFSSKPAAGSTIPADAAIVATVNSNGKPSFDTRAVKMTDPGYYVYTVYTAGNSSYMAVPESKTVIDSQVFRVKALPRAADRFMLWKLAPESEQSIE